MNKIAGFFSTIGAFFSRLMTKHNAVAVATTVERVAVAAGDVAAQNYVGAAAELPGIVSAAKSFTAVDKTPSVAAPETVAPATAPAAK